ncbi:MAG TPA: hypothetical protein VGK19_13210 [Capsulimonadaceae bacterium]
MRLISAVVSVTLLVTVLLLSCAAGLSSNGVVGTRQTQKPNPVFSPQDAGSFSIAEESMTCPVIERYSPDRKFVAFVVTGDAEVSYLYVVPASSHARRDFKRHPRHIVADVHGCIWLP